MAPKRVKSPNSRLMLTSNSAVQTQAARGTNAVQPVGVARLEQPARKVCWSAPPAYLSCRLFQPGNADRLHSICAPGGLRLDSRVAGEHQPAVWTLYTFGSHPCDDLIPPTLCGPGVCTRGMDMDIRHAGIACTCAGGCSSRAQAGRRSMACTTAPSSRTASLSTHCKLAGIGREGEGCDANTTRRSIGRASCRPGAGHAQLCN